MTRSATRALAFGLSSILVLGSACSDDPAMNGNADAQPGADGGPGQDATPGMDAMSMDAEPGMDAPAMDAQEGMDAPAMDAMPMLVAQMEPGDHLQTVEARIEMTDTFATVRQKLGAGTRSAAMNTRSYEWMLSGNVELTIWFANTNLDDDDAPPNDVDDNDLVLWIAVTGGFTGTTSRNIGIGSTRAQVETAAPAGYGPAPHTVDLTNPAGVLAQYFTTGMLVAYDTADMVRTVTICRAYRLEPNGTIDPGGELDFGMAGSIQGLRGLTPGSRISDVAQVLGSPDAEGNVVISGQTLRLLSYGFIGIEVFTSITPGLERVLFMSVHAPYYGTIQGSNAGINSTRADVETALGLGTGVESPMNMNFVCYEGGGEPDVAVTYSTDMPPVATLITVPLLRSSMSMSCP